MARCNVERLGGAPHGVEWSRDTLAPDAGEIGTAAPPGA